MRPSAPRRQSAAAPWRSASRRQQRARNLSTLDAVARDCRRSAGLVPQHHGRSEACSMLETGTQVLVTFPAIAEIGAAPQTAVAWFIGTIATYSSPRRNRPWFFTAFTFRFGN